MRITRSGLRRIIAEEHARILAEAKQYKGSREPHRDGDGDDVQDAIDILNDTGDDYYGSDDPFGDDAALAQDLVDDGAGGWRKKTDDEWAAEQEQGVMDYYGDPDPYGDDEALEMGYEYDGAGGWKKPGLKEGEGKKRHQTPRDRLAAYLDRVGADSAAIMRAVDRAVDRAHEEGSEVTSEDITFNLSNEVLAAIPGDDSDRWHSMLDAVLADEIDPDAFADAERDRQDVEDTERDLSHPSRFLEEGEDDDLGGAASASDSGDREGRRSEHFGDDPDWGPPGHDDWHIDNYDEEGDDIEGSDFDEMIDPADDNDDPMKPAWMNPTPYADTAEDDWTLADDPYVGGRAASAAIRQKYSETGNSDPEDDRSLPRGHRYGVSGGWGGLDEAEVSETYISHWDRDEEADREEDERIRRSLEPSPLSTVHTYPSDRKTSDHPSGLTGMGGPYSEYDHLHYGAGINEARWAKLAGILKG